MSMPRTVTITCSKCGASFETAIFDSINTDFAENLEQSIISGERFSAKCPQCGFMLHLEYDVLYNDMKHNAMIWVIHKEDEQYEKRVSEVRATPILPGVTTRIVNDMNSLREKASCLEHGRNDRVIELCKVVLGSLAEEKYPGFEVKNAYYLFENGKEYICFYDPEEKEVRCDLAQGIYEKMERLLSSGEAQIQKIPYAIIDGTWALDFMASVPLPEPEETSTVLKCPKCGNELPSDSEFCQYCGEKLSAGVEPKPTVSQLPIVHEEHHRSAKVSEKVDDHPAEQKGKVKHCKRCGGVVDKRTKRCAGCGQQYVRLKVLLPILLLSLAVCALGALNVWQYLLAKQNATIISQNDVMISELSKQIDDFYGTTAELEKQISSLKSKKSSLELQVSSLNTQISELEKQNEELLSENLSNLLELWFYRDYAAIVPNNGSNYYHTYSCDDRRASSFWIYNTGEAERRGYYPCPKCH